MHVSYALVHSAIQRTRLFLQSGSTLFQDCKVPMSVICFQGPDTEGRDRILHPLHFTLSICLMNYSLNKSPIGSLNTSAELIEY